MEVVRSKRAAHIARAVGINGPRISRGWRGYMQVAHIIGIAAVTGEAVPGTR